MLSLLKNNLVYFIPINFGPKCYQNIKNEKQKYLVFLTVKVRFRYLHNCLDTKEENTFFFFRAWNSKIKFLLMNSKMITR